jgi:hypothetical protein
MESNNKMQFKIISGDDKLINEVIINYNKVYKTDFKLIAFDYDEVVFAVIEVSIFKPSDVFGLGFQYGLLVQTKRHKQEIDW